MFVMYKSMAKKIAGIPDGSLDQTAINGNGYNNAMKTGIMTNGNSHGNGTNTQLPVSKLDLGHWLSSNT